MEHTERNVSAGFYWYDRPLDADGYLSWLSGLIEKLRDLDSRFSSIFVFDLDTEKAIEVAETDLRNALFACFSKEVAYENRDDSKDKTLHRTSMCLLGFESSLTTSLGSASGYSVAITAGKLAPNKVNSVLINISEDIVDDALARQIFSALISYCKPVHANMNRVEVDDLLAQPPGNVYVGSLTYLSNVKAEEFLPSGVSTSHLEDGLLIDVGGAFAYANETARVSDLQNVIAALGERGFLKNPRKLAK